MAKVGDTRTKNGKAQIYTKDGWRLASKVKENRPKLYAQVMGADEVRTVGPATEGLDLPATGGGDVAGGDVVDEDRPAPVETDIPEWMKGGYLGQGGTKYSQKEILNKINLVFGTNYGTFEDAVAAMEIPLMMAGLAQWQTNRSGQDQMGNQGNTAKDPRLQNVTMQSILESPEAWSKFVGRLYSGKKFGGAGAGVDDLAYWNTLTPDWLYDVRDQYNINKAAGNDPSGMWKFNIDLLTDANLSQETLGSAAGGTALHGLTGFGAGPMGLYGGMTPAELMMFVAPHANAVYHRDAGAPPPPGYEQGLSFGSLLYDKDTGGYLKSPIRSLPMYREYMDRVGGAATNASDVAPGSWASHFDQSMLEEGSQLYWGDTLNREYPYWLTSASYGPNYTPGVGGDNGLGTYNTMNVYDWEKFYGDYDYAQRQKAQQWEQEQQKMIQERIANATKPERTNTPLPPAPSYGYPNPRTTGSVQQSPFGYTPNWGFGNFVF